MILKMVTCKCFLSAPCLETFPDSKSLSFPKLSLTLQFCHHPHSFTPFSMKKMRLLKYLDTVCKINALLCQVLGPISAGCLFFMHAIQHAHLQGCCRSATSQACQAQIMGDVRHHTQQRTDLVSWVTCVASKRTSQMTQVHV